MSKEGVFAFNALAETWFCVAAALVVLRKGAFPSVIQRDSQSALSHVAGLAQGSPGKQPYAWRMGRGGTGSKKQKGNRDLAL